jgi:hypothetical protein
LYSTSIQFILCCLCNQLQCTYLYRQCTHKSSRPCNATWKHRHAIALLAQWDDAAEWTTGRHNEQCQPVRWSLGCRKNNHWLNFIQKEHSKTEGKEHATGSTELHQIPKTSCGSFHVGWDKHESSLRWPLKWKLCCAFSCTYTIFIKNLLYQIPA